MKKMIRKTSKKASLKTAQEIKPADERRQFQRMQLLLNVSRQMAALNTLDEVLQAIMEIATMETNSERGSLFLIDHQTSELYSRIALGVNMREIRILSTSGIAGHVYTTGNGVIVHDTYKDSRFNRFIDEQTGFVTKSVICSPIKTVKGTVIGVIQTLNKKKGKYNSGDMELLEELTTQAANTLQHVQYVESMKKSRKQEMEFLNVVSDVTSEIDLGTMLQKVMGEATRMLNAERSTLFLNDEKSGELFSRIAQGDSIGEIRLPNHVGIAGTVLTSGETINIPYAYADLRFSPAFDKKTGYFTRSILCVPIINKDGKAIGVTQVLNKLNGTFTNEDESRLKAFTAHVSIALENAKLFEDVQNMKNYSESMLESMSNAVITLDDEGKIVTCNAAGLRIIKVSSNDIIDKKSDEFFTDKSI